MDSVIIYIYLEVSSHKFSELQKIVFLVRERPTIAPLNLTKHDLVHT